VELGTIQTPNGDATSTLSPSLHLSFQRPNFLLNERSGRSPILRLNVSLRLLFVLGYSSLHLTGPGLHPAKILDRFVGDLEVLQDFELQELAGVGWIGYANSCL
jgi:hypothetical protein